MTVWRMSRRGLGARPAEYLVFFASVYVIVELFT